MQLARSAKVNLSSNAVRRKFLEYFCGQKDHRLVRSSPVLPHRDPTLAFCNAGMNQFKSVLLGTALPPGGRVANSQKCVRVGGKHNDLSQVGTDGTHHTFFEMLGNWSFGDYFKEEACAMAWELLVDVYGLNPSHLHVTYFGGDKKMGLPADVSTRDIWRSIGLADDRLRPGSAADNFWEMGDSGPCGGCTEIHYLPPGLTPIAGNMLEIWNLVFIEFLRDVDGSLHTLSSQNVDTGMGFERLVSVLQGFNSNYDTDLFTPLFRAIHNVSGRAEYSGRYGSEDDSGLDTAYRILADHSRMFTVCLADGFIPEQEGKLRGIIRKALSVSRDVFGAEEGLLRDLSCVVADTLREPYPEITRNLSRVHYIINHEAEFLRALHKDRLGEWHALCQRQPHLHALSVGECPNLLPAYQRLMEILSESPQEDDHLSPESAWKICETFGVPQNLAPQLATVVGLKLDENELEQHINNCKVEKRKDMYVSECASRWSFTASMVHELRKEGIQSTEDRYKYEYLHGYNDLPTFPDQPASIVALIVDGQVVNYISPELLMVAECEIGVILDRSNMYCEEGGQTSDLGFITLQSHNQLPVQHVTECTGYIVHWLHTPCSFPLGLRVNAECSVIINAERRMSLMKNHTATHLLNAALRKKLNIVDQKSSRVYPQHFAFDFNVYKETLTSTDIQEVEDIVVSVIRHGVPVRRRSVDSDELHRIEMVTTLPGETYHHHPIHLIEINSGYFLSREPCCGTHVMQTSHIQDFVITNFKSLSSSTKSMRAVTGEYAAQARCNAKAFYNELIFLEESVNEAVREFTGDENKIGECSSRLDAFLRAIEETELLSYVVAEKLHAQVEKLRIGLKFTARGSLRLSMEEEMQTVISRNRMPYLVHNIRSASKLDSVPLAKASRMCPQIPSFIFGGSGGFFKARCCVPQELVTKEFSAQHWMDDVMVVAKGQCGPPRGQSAALVCNMKAKKLTEQELQGAVQRANDFAQRALVKT